MKEARASEEDQCEVGRRRVQQRKKAGSNSRTVVRHQTGVGSASPPRSLIKDKQTIRSSPVTKRKGIHGQKLQVTPRFALLYRR